MRDRSRVLLENDDNIASHMRGGYFNAQWSDDIHHALHMLLTGETDGYHIDYTDEPAAKSARALAEGFIFQGEPAKVRSGKPRRAPSGDLPASAFVTFLQTMIRLIIEHSASGSRASQIHSGLRPPFPCSFSARKFP